MEDLRQRPDENRSQYGWRLLMHDLRNPKGTLPPQPEQQITEKASVTNIINNYPSGIPMTSTRFRFASIYATIATLVILTIAVILLAKVGFFDYLWMWLL